MHVISTEAEGETERSIQNRFLHAACPKRCRTDPNIGWNSGRNDTLARVVSGYIVRFDWESPKHNWAEVYLREYGWVPFHLSAADIENVIIRGRSFSRMQPAYLYLSHIRNDEILGDNPFGAYIFWGDKPRFKESIDFEPFAPWTAISR